MKTNQKLTVSIHPVAIIILLALVIIGMFALWRPWEGTKTQRTITVTGTAEISATPDEFIFSPYFKRTGSDTAKLKSDLDTFGMQLQSKLEALGVPSGNITLMSSNYGQSTAIAPGGTTADNGQSTITLMATIKTSTEELAQKVQDYLATTDAEGQTTSQASFSKQKSQQLEDQARDAAAKDARSKADRTAKDLGGSVGKVISVKDSPVPSPIYPMTAISGNAQASLPVTPGQNKVDFNVEAVFELR